MTRINIISFLPKIAREYGIDESLTREYKINTYQAKSPQPLISAGWFSSILSNNRIDIHTSQETKSTSEQKKKKQTPNYFQLAIIGVITGVTSAFALGRLHSSIATVENNICLSNQVIAHPSSYGANLDNDTILDIHNIANVYKNAEIERKNKLSHYQTSLFGTVLGIGTSIVGSIAAINLVSTIGMITIIASSTFGIYTLARHWDDFTRAQNQLRDLKLSEIIIECQNQSNNFLESMSFQTSPEPSAPPMQEHDIYSQDFRIQQEQLFSQYRLSPSAPPL